MYLANVYPKITRTARCESLNCTYRLNHFHNDTIVDDRLSFTFWHCLLIPSIQVKSNPTQEEISRAMESLVKLTKAQGDTSELGGNIELSAEILQTVVDFNAKHQGITAKKDEDLEVSWPNDKDLLKCEWNLLYENYICMYRDTLLFGCHHECWLCTIVMCLAVANTEKCII